MKKLVVPLLAVALVVSLAFNVVAYDPIKIVVNGKEVVSDVAPQIIEGRTMVPIRVIAEALDMNVSWDDGARTVNIASKTSPAQPQQTAPSTPQTQPPAATTPPQQNSGLITKSKFDQITEGMTYEQVKSILGSPGELLKLTDDFKYMNDLHMVVYTFEGVGGEAQIIFKDNQVFKKIGFGLR